MHRTRTVVTILLISLAFTLAACETPKWDDPNYVNKKLLDEDKGTRGLAMSNISQLKQEQLPQIVPGLLNVYNKDTIYKRDAMMQLLQIKSPEAKDAYLHELKTNESDYALGAASTLGALGDRSVNKSLLEVYNSTDKDDLKLAILRALVELPSPELVPDLIKTLKLDVDRRPIALLALSCDILSKVAVEDPKAISDEAVKQITLAMFFANRIQQSLSQDCGLAVQALGERAVPELLKIYKGEREDVKALFLKYDSPESPYPENLAKLIAVQRLVTLRANPLIPLAVEDLNSTKEPPKDFSKAAKVGWLMNEGRLTSEEIYALGDLQDQDARPLLESIVKGEKINKEWNEITDMLVELQFRQDASFALVRLGNREALPTLLDVAKNGVIADLEKSAAYQAKKGTPIKDTERYQMNWVIAQSYANLALPKDRPLFEELIESKRASAPELAKKLESMLVMFDVAKECMAKPDPKGQAACYGEKLEKSGDALVIEKAAWELGRLPKEVATPVMNKVLSKKDVALREILEFYLYKYGNAETVKVIEKLLEGRKDAGSKYALDFFRLQLLRLYLLTHGAAK